jgi:hypothetical protein
MRRLSSLAIFLALAGSIVTVVVVRTWANDPQPTTKPNASSWGGGGGGYLGPAESAARPPGPSAQASAVSPPPPAPALQPQAWTVLREPKEPAPFARILTPEMAATRETQTIIDADTSAESPAVLKINAALEAPTEFAFKETPLNDVIEQLKKRHKIEIQLDSGGLKDGGVDERVLVTKSVKGISLRAALHLLLDEYMLKYVIHNEVLLITSPQKAESDEFMTTRMYPVKDLVMVRNESGEIETDFQSLTDLIANTVVQKSWVDNGGNGTISPFQFQDRCLLVIAQTQEVHEQIVAFLGALRRCGEADAKPGNELRLPKRPKRTTPTYYVVPGSPPPAVHGRGGGFEGGGLGAGGFGGGGYF